MLKISNIKIYGLEESIVASGYPMLSKPYTEEEFKDEKQNLKKWLEEYDLKYVIERLNYKPKGYDFNKEETWPKNEINEIKISESKKHAILITRDNNCKINGEFKIDFKDIHKIKNIKFNLSSTGYAYSQTKGCLLHRLIKSETGMITDHKNRNIKDNRDANLRICTRQENNSNSESEGFSFRKDRNKWRAYIMINRRQISLGMYETKEEALQARINGELEYFGEFSKHYNHNLEENNDYGFNSALKMYKRSTKLGSVEIGTGHDNMLKGIIVQYDVRYPVYWSPQFQRYSGHNHIVSSMSSMHRLVKMNLDESFNEYVLPQVKGEIEWLIELYNNCLKDKEKYKVYSWKSSYHDELCFAHFKEEILELEDCIPESIKEISPEELYMYIISSCPQGLEKTMRVSTNYLQLKTMWHQRRNHKLKDWQIFCDEIEKLPYFKELTGCGL